MVGGWEFGSLFLYCVSVSALEGTEFPKLIAREGGGEENLEETDKQQDEEDDSAVVVGTTTNRMST